MSDGDECVACDLARGNIDLPGGLIHRTKHWLVEHCIGPLGAGTLIVKPERHVVHVADLSDDEADELGALLRTTSAVVTALTNPAQVYVAGELSLHDERSSVRRAQVIRSVFFMVRI